MPIKVSCACGSAFAAKDELAGKTVKCPKCQQPLTIPGGAAPTPRQAPAQRQAAPQPVPDSTAPSIFDDAGMKARQATGQVCPGCYHPMKAGTIVCVHCGFSLQLGRKMEMQVFGKGEGGHGEAAGQALQRAANMLEDDKREERKKVNEGVPWWAWLILFCAATGLLTMMLLLPAAIATNIALGFLFGGGVLIVTYAQICVLMVAFKDNVVQGLLVLLIPGYFFIYVIIKWDLAGSLFLLWLGGWVIIGVAIVIYVAIGMGLNNAAELPLPARPSVALIRFTDELPLRIERKSV
ncbi:MAG: hypothetical protein IAF94_13390 [Pirellulaceae bacterium]|nr:hypothetical protein [Pirellulaceae bacterium]